jgi:hypothetical protein
MNAPLEIKPLKQGIAPQHRSPRRKPPLAGGRTKPALKRPGHGNAHQKEYYRALRAAEMAVWNQPRRKRTRSSPASREESKPLNPGQILLAGLGFLFLAMFLGSVSGGWAGQELSSPVQGLLDWLKTAFV